MEQGTPWMKKRIDTLMTDDYQQWKYSIKIVFIRIISKGEAWLMNGDIKTFYLTIGYVLADDA